MRGVLVLFLALALAGCATSQISPEQACREINPDPAMLSLGSPVEVTPGVKLGSVGAAMRGGQCRVTGTFYIDTQVIGLARASEFRQQATDLVRQSLQQYPPGAVTARYQFLPTPPMEPFTVELEAGK